MRVYNEVLDQHSEWLSSMVDSLLLTLEGSKLQEEREADLIVLRCESSDDLIPFPMIGWISATGTWAVTQSMLSLQRKKTILYKDKVRNEIEDFLCQCQTSPSGTLLRQWRIRGYYSAGWLSRAVSLLCKATEE